ncbi:hypothetical protein L914_12916 [Phytophthora nicotianae]|uniref:Jacalin-type lectin domain-containing protein n=1 Tax=Phytophthora nicotianae TaxID=4792 RepID=W2N0U1_PHYNI|nr:hypothetical protein L914_12916 [Phytophthora nicotianae]
MKSTPQVLAAMAMVVVGTAALQEGIIIGKTFGGPHGDEYSDYHLVTADQMVHCLTIRFADRVDAVSLNVTDPAGQKTTFYHGGEDGDPKTHCLADNEHFTGYQAHWGKYYRKTRLMYVEFTTDKGETISGGTPTDDSGSKGKDTAPSGYQLGGFVGYSGNELDSMGAIWTRIKPVV